LLNNSFPIPFTQQLRSWLQCRIIFMELRQRDIERRGTI
jgi:hypothetical protein